jgi:integrase
MPHSYGFSPRRTSRRATGTVATPSSFGSWQMRRRHGTLKCMSQQTPLTFRDLIEDFEKAYLPTLAAPTRSKYASLLRVHLKPAFAIMQVESITTKVIDQFLATKCQEGLSWATRLALRNLVSSIFRRAEIWGTYEGKNPARYATIGRKRSAREKRKLTIEQTKTLLIELRADVRIVCMVALFCALRISEVLGLQWKHVDFDRKMFLIRQRYWRGDVDCTKSEMAERDIPYGDLHSLLKTLYPGEHAVERYCFDVRTKSVAGFTRDDRSIRRYFLRPTAKRLGLYYRGFGFHAFRREALTAIAREAGAMQACKVAGHTRMDHTLLYYELDEHAEQERAILTIQEPYVSAGLLRLTK